MGRVRDPDPPRDHHPSLVLSRDVHDCHRGNRTTAPYRFNICADRWITYDSGVEFVGDDVR